MKNELEDYLDQVKGHFKVQDVGFYFSWVKSVYIPVYDLILSNNSASVCCSITEFEIASCKTSLKELAGQKIENMINSLAYEHGTPKVTPGKPLKELKVEPPQVESLDELYAGADWEGIISQDVKVKSKSKKPTAAELEFKYKHQGKADWTSKLDQINEILVKKYKEEVFAESPLLKHLKSK